MPASTLALLFLQLAALAAGLIALRRTPRAGESSVSQRIGALAACAAMAAFVFAISEPRPLFADFRKAYYPAGQAVLDSPGALAPLIESVYFVNLPIVAYLFAPLGSLPLKWAAAIFFLLGVAATFTAWRILVCEARLDARGALMLALLFAASGPLQYGIREGNTSHMVLLALVGALALLRRGHAFAAGALLGSAALIKLPLLLFGPYFVLRRNWASAAGFALPLSAAGLLSVSVFGWDLHRRWFELCVVQFSSHPIGAFNVQSIPAFLARLTAGPEILRDWTAVMLDPTLRLAGSLLVGLMYLAAVAVCLKTPKFIGTEAEDWKLLEYLLVVTLAVVASPLSWSHYYTWLLMPFAFFLSMESRIAASAAARRLAWLGIFLVSPAVVTLVFATPWLVTAHVRLSASHALFGGLVWLGLLLHARAMATGLESRTEGRPGRSALVKESAA